MAEATTKPRRGCCFYGCISGLVVMLIVVVAGLIGLHYAKKMFNQFTDSQPLALPPVQMSQVEIDNLHERIDAFQKALHEHQPAEPLTLTSDEINALIATSPNLRGWKGKFYVTLEGEQVKGQLSVPLEEIGLRIFKGRYLNASGTFHFSFHNGVLRFTAQQLAVKGKPVPELYMQSIRQQDLAQNVKNDPQTKADLDQFKEIEIKDSKLVLVPKESP